jgi:hypothetical protein
MKPINFYFLFNKSKVIKKFGEARKSGEWRMSKMAATER